MPASTPIARSNTAALARVVDSVPKGYHRYTHGSVKASKAERLANKFHALYGISSTPAQRLTRRQKGQANAVLVMFWPEGAEWVEWLLLATDGTGMDAEAWKRVTERPRLIWLGYELVRREARGRTAWTWRRTRQEMEELYALVTSQAQQRHFAALIATLERIARQPGFHGVRTQSWALCQEAYRLGYSRKLPHLFYVKKVSHGEPLMLLSQSNGQSLHPNLCTK